MRNDQHRDHEGSRSGPGGGTIGRHTLFQLCDEEIGHIETGLRRDLHEPGGTGDVDLGEAVANHIQTHQEQHHHHAELGHVLDALDLLAHQTKNRTDHQRILRLR